MGDDKMTTASNKFRLSVEPAVLLLSFALTLSGNVLQNLMLARICTRQVDNSTVCHNLQDFPEQEKLAQPEATVLFMGKHLIEALFPAVLSFFVGPWSDVHGRKPLLLAPLAGHSLLYLGLLFLSLDFAAHWDVRWFLFPSVFVSFSGGMVAFVTGSFSSITDMSTENERSWRMGLVEAGLLIGLPLGLACSSFVLAWGGYQTVFGLSATASIIGLLYVYWMVPETVDRRDDKATRTLGSLFDYQLIVDMVRTCLKKRPGYRRETNLMVMATLASAALAFQGEISVLYLYTRGRFQWDLRDYSLFSSITICIAALGTVIGLYVLSKRLRIPDAPLAVAAFVGRCISAVVMSVAAVPGVLYLGSAFNILGGLAPPLGRTILSKSVPKEDIGSEYDLLFDVLGSYGFSLNYASPTRVQGKIFSLTASLDALIPLAAAPLYAIIYRRTLTTMASAFFLLTAGVYLVDIVLLCIVTGLHYKFPI